MGDLTTIQKQLEALLTMYKENKREMNSRFEELSLQVTQSRAESLGNDLDRTITKAHLNPGITTFSLCPAFRDWISRHLMENPIHWTQSEQFFVHHNTPDAQMVSTASLHLEGDSQNWFFKLGKWYLDLTREEFKAQFNRRFSPTVREDTPGELSMLRQTGTVEDYIQRFEI